MRDGPIDTPVFPDADPLLILSVVIMAGLVSGALARRMGLAGVTGQILVGVILGHSGLELFSGGDVTALAPVTNFSLGLIAVTVGGHLNLRRMRNARKRLGLLVLFEMTITPTVVYFATQAAGADWRTSLLLSALAVSTAPATIVALVHEMRAKGVFTKTLLGAVALNNIGCIFLFEVAHMASRVGLAAGEAPEGYEYVLEPLLELLMAALLGAGLGSGLIALTRKVFRANRLATASVTAVLMAVGIADALEISSLLACLFLGMTLANLTPDKDEIVESAFVNVRDAIFAIFFTLAGMHLDLDQLLVAGVLAGAIIFGRIIGKVVSARLALGLAGATDRVKRYLGLALVPQAGVAVGLLLVLQDDPAMAGLAPSLLAIGLTTVAVNELVGPVLVRRALKKCGEAQMDRARLIDFIHEENIVTNLKADSKEDAIRQLVEVLIRTNHLDADRERLLRSVLDREEDMSTCFGEGLAIPHGNPAERRDDGRGHGHQQGRVGVRHPRWRSGALHGGPGHTSGGPGPPPPGARRARPAWWVRIGTCGVSCSTRRVRGTSTTCCTRTRPRTSTASWTTRRRRDEQPRALGAAGRPGAAPGRRGVDGRIPGGGGDPEPTPAPRAPRHPRGAGLGSRVDLAPDGGHASPLAGWVVEPPGAALGNGADVPWQGRVPLGGASRLPRLAGLPLPLHRHARPRGE